MALFSNHQWAVTDGGIESVKPAPTYQVPLKRLTEMDDYGSGLVYSWLPHMAEKTWVDIEAFIEAFTRALDVHAGGYSPESDADTLAKSVEAGRQHKLRWG